MTLIALIELVAQIAGIGADLVEVVEFLQKSGHDPAAPIPAEHLEKVRAALGNLPDSTEWDADHTNS